MSGPDLKTENDYRACVGWVLRSSNEQTDNLRIALNSAKTAFEAGAWEGDTAGSRYEIFIALRDDLCRIANNCSDAIKAAYDAEPEKVYMEDSRAKWSVTHPR